MVAFHENILDDAQDRQPIQDDHKHLDDLVDTCRVEECTASTEVEEDR